MKSRIPACVFALLLGQSTLAEFRTWTGTTGSQLKAELVKEMDGVVVLSDESGRELKVPRSYLSEQDIEYLDSLGVPVLGIQSDIKVEAVLKPGLGVVQTVRYNIAVRKISSDPYESPVNVVLYLIGTVGGDNAYVVLQHTRGSLQFTANNRNPNMTGPELVLGSPDLKQKYSIDYAGYLVVVSSKGGRIIAVDADNKTFESNAGYISKFKAGDLFGADMKLIP